MNIQRHNDDKFKGWTKRDIDMHLCGLESYMVHHELTEDELHEYMDAIDDAQRAILRAFVKDEEGWNIVNLKDILDKYPRKDNDVQD